MINELEKGLVIIDKFHKILEPAIVSQDITFKCPDNIGIYSVMIKLDQGIGRKFKKKIDFNFPNIIRLNIKSFPQFETQNKAIIRTNSGFSIKTDDLSNSDFFMIEIEYKIQEKNFSDFLVKKNVETEALGKDKNEYWMHAQLKHLSVLNTKYGQLDLQDVDLIIDVGVHKDIKELVPMKLIKSLEITKEWILEKDIEKKAKLSRSHVYSQRAGLKDNEMDLLNQMQELFYSGVFGQYVNAESPFHISDCIRGTDFYDKVPFLTIPKTMQVISRTDLNFDNPVSDGKMVYNKGKFLDKITEIFD